MRATLTLLFAVVLVVTLPAVPAGQNGRGSVATTGVVVSYSAVASDIGAEILARGGSAVDAAIATAFALAVTHPAAGNIGGGGFMVVRTPDGRATTFDYRERAPGKSTPTMYVGDDGNIVRARTNAGYLASGVPGTVRGLELAHQRFGKLPWREVVMPAVDVALRGFYMPGSTARGLNGEIRGPMKAFPASVEAYGKPGGGEWQEGDRLALPDLARSLQAIADDPNAFYTGWIADRIADDMAANGGIITREDLAAYRAVERQPVRATVLGHEIISMPPPSSGGTAMIQMLNILEAAGIQKTTRGSAEAHHLIAESMRRAFLDRARHLGDPDFVTVPVPRLISKPYARDLAQAMSRTAATKSVELGKDIVSAGLPPESDETTHFSVIDRDGMAVANTYTLEGSYGSHVVIRGTGILMNNEMGDFNKKPGLTNLTGDIGTDANLIAPGKRMLSSMTPTIVTRGGRMVLITGSPGGRTIINTVMNIVLNVTAWGMDGRAAVEAPRSHHQWLPDRYDIERGGATDAVIAALEAMGHDVRTVSRQGAAHSIWIDPATGAAVGIADRRDDASKASVAGR